MKKNAILQHRGKGKNPTFSIQSVIVFSILILQPEEVTDYWRHKGSYKVGQRKGVVNNSDILALKFIRQTC